MMWKDAGIWGLDGSRTIQSPNLVVFKGKFFMNGLVTKKQLIRNKITWIAYILLSIYAYFLNILGPITPFLHDELHLSYTVSSLHFSAFAIGILVVGLVGNMLIRRTGRQQALSIGAVGLGLGALLLSIGRSPIVTIGAAFFMGCIGSLILAVVPALLSDEHGELRPQAISEANVLSSLVSASAALLVGWFANLVIGWRMALILVALVSIGLGIRFFQPFRSSEHPVNSHQSRSSLPYAYWVYWMAIVLAVSIEFCMIFWSADYMEGELRMHRTNAVQMVSLFLGGMILGRLISSWILRYIEAYKVVLVSVLFGLLSFLLLWRTGNVLVGMIGLALTGFFVASLYPLLLSIAIGAAQGNTVQAGARATLASGTAILVLPLVLGRLADSIGLRDAFAVVAFLFVSLIFILSVAWVKFTPERNSATF
jgi:fucose permease